MLYSSRSYQKDQDQGQLSLRFRLPQRKALGQHPLGHKRKATIKDKGGNKRAYTMEVEEEKEETDADEEEEKDELEHFEPSKVGMLARCLCIPLVSIRVGKINKQGTLLCPTSTKNCIMSYMPWTDLNKIIGASNRKRTTQMLLKECVLLGAIPFPADVERLKDLGVCELGMLCYLKCMHLFN